MEAMETSSNFLCLWHISKTSSPFHHFSRYFLSPGFCLFVCRMQTLKRETNEALKFSFNFVDVLFFVSNDEITEKWKIAQILFSWVGSRIVFVVKYVLAFLLFSLFSCKNKNIFDKYFNTFNFCGRCTRQIVLSNFR